MLADKAATAGNQYRCHNRSPHRLSDRLRKAKPRPATFEYPIPTIWKVTSITLRTAILASSHRNDHRAVNKTSSAVVVRWNLRRSNEKARVMQRDAYHGVHRRPAVPSRKKGGQ
jgi:hypothetical protein